VSGGEDIGGLSRRQLLGGAAAAAAALTAAPARAKEAGAAEAEAVAALDQNAAPAPAPGQWFDLRCAFKEQVFDGHRVRLRAYNGQVPGPTITTRANEMMRVRLRNGLTPYDSTGWNGDHNVPHQLDTTNLHFHGMEVMPHLFQPLGTSNPAAAMIAVGPGETYDYPMQLPDDHPPGLYWYHPHHHGSTAVQVVTGMAGAIIVKGAIDEVPAIKAARDITLIVQDIGLFPSDEQDGLWTYEPKQNAIWQTFGGNVTMWDPDTQQPVPQPQLKGGFTTGDYALRFYLLNGQPFFKETHNPAAPTIPVAKQLKPQRIRIAPGEVVRFRMLNGTSDNLMPILVEGHEMHLIALDGVNFTQTRTIPVNGAGDGNGQVLLAPANRAEFLIQGGKPGVYRMIQIEQSQQFLDSAEKVICEIEVTGKAKPMALPTDLPPPKRYYPLIDPKKVTRIRNVEFSGAFPGTMNPVVGIDFLINNMQYQEDAVPMVLTLGDREQWNLIVEGEHHGGTEGHPFHIHEVSFEVISVGGVAQPPGTIMDTVWVPKDTVVVIRMHFAGLPGKTVYHCHILPHEDTGMMQNILFAEKGYGSGHGGGSGGAKGGSGHGGHGGH
jgi:FtsP/CotA-like multicopper oxidase with cupredoxin domain